MISLRTRASRRQIEGVTATETIPDRCHALNYSREGCFPGVEAHKHSLCASRAMTGPFGIPPGIISADTMAKDNGAGRGS